MRLRRRRASRPDPTPLGFGPDLVRALLRAQHPDLADLELTEVVGGWDNQQWRLGDELAVRMPRTERAPALLRIEQRWLPVLAEQLPLPVPTPVRIGEASERFPHPWTVARWVDGDPADTAPISRPDAPATLASFLRALHQAAPADTPTNGDSGIPLGAVPGGIDRWLEVVDDRAIAGAVRTVWKDAIAAPVWDGPPMWIHGDLHPANVIVQDGALVGVIDFGEMCGGDPATDLSAAWILLPAGAADSLFVSYGNADDATIARARGWAVLRALHLLAIGRNGRLGLPGGKPTWEPAGHTTLERVLALG